MKQTINAINSNEATVRLNSKEDWEALLSGEQQGSLGESLKDGTLTKALLALDKEGFFDNVSILGETIKLNEHVSAYYDTDQSAFRLICTKPFIKQLGNDIHPVRLGVMGGWVEDLSSLKGLSWVAEGIKVRVGAYLEDTILTLRSKMACTVNMSNFIAVNSLLYCNTVRNAVVINSMVNVVQINKSFIYKSVMTAGNCLVMNSYVLLGHKYRKAILTDVMRNRFNVGSGFILITPNHGFAYSSGLDCKSLAYFDIDYNKNLMVYDEVGNSLGCVNVSDIEIKAERENDVAETVAVAREVLEIVLANETLVDCLKENARIRGQHGVFGKARTSVAAYWYQHGNSVVRQYEGLAAKLHAAFDSLAW